MSENSRKVFFLFLAGWITLNVLQSVTTELFNDEALYWAFAQRPAFGYFDHPPLTAWLIALTSWIPGELGVRLPFILLSASTIYFLWRILEPDDMLLFVALILGVPLIHVGGFFAAPDVPLLFLVAAFLFAYKSYFYKDSLGIAVILGLLLGLMGIAKYHAILFAIALGLSNLELFKRRSFYIGILVALVVILPHIVWEWQHDWVSFEFHLFSRRGAQPWEWNFFGDYIVGQIIAYGLLLTILMWIASVRRQPSDHYDCAFKYLFYTVFIFFTASVFRGRVEANWTAMAFVPMFYLTYLFVRERPLWRKWTIGLAIFSLVFVMALRVILAFEIIPAEKMSRNETHGFEPWAQKIKDAADGDPVVFINSYRKAAKFSFYADGLTTSWNMAEYSGNQYDVWTEDEIALQGRSVYAVSNELSGQDSLHFDHGIQSECVIRFPEWYSFNYLKIEGDPQESATAGSSSQIRLTITNPTDFAPVKGGGAIEVRAVFMQYEETQFEATLIEDLDVTEIGSGGQSEREVTLTFPAEPGEYVLKFAIVSQGLPGLNSAPYFVEVR